MKRHWCDYIRDDTTLVMGVLNVTSDSFSDGGLFIDTEDALMQAHRMIQEGADIIDIGGQSTRPGATPTTPREELDRVTPVVERLASETTIPLSIDTFSPEVADACLSLGASILNDVCGLQDPAMRQVAVKHGKPVILMHMRGTPKTMQQDIFYSDVIADLKEFFIRSIGEARESGVQEIAIDPGIGFGKTVKHNLEILQRCGELKVLECPLLVGPSRKSFIGNITGNPVGDRVDGTIAACVVAAMNGANIVRVHDVKNVKKALLVADAIRLHSTTARGPIK